MRISKDKDSVGQKINFHTDFDEAGKNRILLWFLQNFTHICIQVFSKYGKNFKLPVALVLKTHFFKRNSTAD